MDTTGQHMKRIFCRESCRPNDCSKTLPGFAGTVLFALFPLPFATCMIKLQELHYLYPFKLSSICFLHSKISDSNLFPHIKGKKISIVCKHCVCMYVWEVFCNVDAVIGLRATASKTRIMSWRCPLSGSPCGTMKPPCIFVPAVKKYVFQAFWKWCLLLSGGDLICNEELFYWLYGKSRHCCLAESCP